MLKLQENMKQIFPNSKMTIQPLFFFRRSAARELRSTLKEFEYSELLCHLNKLHTQQGYKVSHWWRHNQTTPSGLHHVLSCACVRKVCFTIHFCVISGSWQISQKFVNIPKYKHDSQKIFSQRNLSQIYRCLVFITSHNITSKMVYMLIFFGKIIFSYSDILSSNICLLNFS